MLVRHGCYLTATEHTLQSSLQKFKSHQNRAETSFSRVPHLEIDRSTPKQIVFHIYDKLDSQRNMQPSSGYLTDSLNAVFWMVKESSFARTNAQEKLNYNIQ